MTTKKDSFKIMGLSVRTTNENNRAMNDIPALWERFFAENTSGKITGKESDELYCVYTDYEKDHTRPYTTILGHKVSHSAPLPEGLVETLIPGQTYTVFTSKGNPKEAVYQEWLKIWNTDLERRFSADFEVYGARSQDPENPEVDIFIALK